MQRDIFRYAFKTDIPTQDIEETLLLSVLAAEGLHGQSRVRLEASYYMDANKHACVIDATTDVGRDVVKLFTGFAIREFGEESFNVRCVDHAPDMAKATT